MRTSIDINRQANCTPQANRVLHAGSPPREDIMLSSETPRPVHREPSAGLPQRIAAASLSLALAGCAVGPDFTRPDAPATASYGTQPLPATTVSTEADFGAAQRFLQGLDVDGRWWTQFKSPQLNALVDEAFKSNPDIKAAQAALRQAEEAVLAGEGVFYPNLQASYQVSRQKNAVGTLAPTLTSGEPVFNLHTAQLTLGYVPDVFGGNRRLVESLVAQSDIQRQQLEATYLTLVSNVVVAAIQAASLATQIKATEDVIRIESELVALLRRQNALGAIAESDVLAQESTLAQTQATLPALERQLAQQSHALAALTGHFPGDAAGANFELAALTLPLDLPVTLPGKLVEQRPDVRAAEAQLHVASAQLGVAIANRLPQFAISGGVGGASTAFGSLFSAGNTFWNVGLGLAQPVFDGGTLLHRKRGAEAAYEQAAQQYRSTVVTAVQNVADTLSALELDAKALEASARADKAADVSLKVARKSVELGSTTYLAALQAEQTYQQVHISLVQAQANRFSDTAALFQALGGGWWNRSDVVGMAH